MSGEPAQPSEEPQPEDVQDGVVPEGEIEPGVHPSQSGEYVRPGVGPSESGAHVMPGVHEDEDEVVLDDEAEQGS
ncbi:MAG TPA: hypothetical protein DEA08_35835 [Planctomycetes bacterium]|nr:hypothetical protein [Planctomycetota bacterium]